MKNIADKCKEISLVTFGEPVPFQELLADLAKVKQDEYHVVLMQWLQDHTSQLPPAHTWLMSRGLELKDYCEHMVDDGQADGLEVWLVCLALNVNINIIQEDHIWSAMQ